MHATLKSLLVSLTVCGLSTSALAVVRTWDGQGADSLFSNPVNWDGNLTIPNPNDDLQFGPDMGVPVTNAVAFDTNAAFDVTSLTFLANASPYQITKIGQESINLKATGVALQNLSNSRQTFFAIPLNVSASTQTWNGGASGIVFAPIDLGNNHTLTIDGTGTSATTRNELSGGISGTQTVAGTSGLTKTGIGTLFFNTATPSVYVGATTISGGTLLLGKAEQIPNGSNLVLNGGTLNTGGFDETVGVLSLTNSSTIDFGTSNTSDLVFSASSSQNFGAFTLNITNFNTGQDTLRFLANPDASPGLTSAQLLANIRFNGTTPGQINAQGFVTPIPEPSAFGLALVGAVGILGSRRRRN